MNPPKRMTPGPRRALTWLLAVFLGSLATSCRPPGGAGGPVGTSAETIPPFDPEKLELFYELTVDQAESLIKNARDIVIVDIRQPDHFAAAHLAGARSLPFPSRSFQKELESLGPHTKILIYGYSRDYMLEEKNAMDAINVLRALDFRTIYFLTDGYPGWIESKKPVVDLEGRLVAEPPKGPMPEAAPDGSATAPAIPN